MTAAVWHSCDAENYAELNATDRKPDYDIPLQPDLITN